MLYIYNIYIYIRLHWQNAMPMYTYIYVRTYCMWAFLAIHLYAPVKSTMHRSQYVRIAHGQSILRHFWMHDANWQQLKAVFIHSKCSCPMLSMCICQLKRLLRSCMCYIRFQPEIIRRNDGHRCILPFNVSEAWLLSLSGNGGWVHWVTRDQDMWGSWWIMI